jgi:hypothetical protein
MNIADKPALYTAIERVLAGNGRFVLESGIYCKLFRSS